jgi:Flp pilus assembly pilin Flp
MSLRTRAIRSALGRLVREEGGQMAVEWALVMVVVALPFFFVFRALLAVLIAHYQMVTFLQSLPFP